MKYYIVLVLLLGVSAVQAKTINILNSPYNATSQDSSNDDGIAFNLAIAAANPGDTVFAPSGKYHIKTPIRLKSGVSIKGESSSNTEIAGIISGSVNCLKEDFVGVPKEDTISCMIRGLGVDDVIVENFRIRSNSAALDKGIDRIIQITNSSNVRIKKSKFERFNKHAVYFNNTVNGQVSLSTFENATKVEQGGYGYGVVFTNGSSNGRVDTSIFTGPMIRHGVVIQGQKEPWNPSHHINVIDNTFIDTAQDAIDLHGYGEYNNYVENNIIIGTGTYPNVGRGIGVGEDVHGPSGTGNVIKGNTITGTRFGIHVLTGSSDVVIRYNTIENCQRYGIYIQDGSQLDIRDNVISGCGNWGIKMDKGNDIVIRKATLQGNIVNFNGLQTSSRGGVIVNQGVTGINIQDNDFCNNDFTGGASSNFVNLGSGVVQNNLCVDLP